MLEKYDLPLKTELMHFIESRRNMRKPLNAYAFELALDKLNSLSTDTEEQIAIVKQAIANGWQGFYPLAKEESSKKHSKYIHTASMPDYTRKPIEPSEKATEEQLLEAENLLNGLKELNGLKGQNV